MIIHAVSESKGIVKCSEAGSKKDMQSAGNPESERISTPAPGAACILALFRRAVFVVKFKLMFCILPERHHPGNRSKTLPLPMTLQYTGPMSTGRYIEEVPEEDPDEAA